MHGVHSAIRTRDAQRSSQFRLIEGAVLHFGHKNGSGIETTFANEMVLFANLATFHILLLVAFATDSFGHGTLLPQKCLRFPSMRDLARLIAGFLIGNIILDAGQQTILFALDSTRFAPCQRHLCLIIIRKQRPKQSPFQQNWRSGSSDSYLTCKITC